ncbi:MAG: M28 family peptidase [Ignavibacteria bacterium]|jgi:subtilisin-like proprotein convertase family protein|nr:M28 family peptidase [Ignavibacteria bacterium]
METSTPELLRKKKFVILIAVVLSGLISTVNSQVVYTHKIDSIVNLVSIQQLIKTNKEITGDTITVIGGIPRRIISRVQGTEGNSLAAKYLYERFSGYGLETRYQIKGADTLNVIARKKGTKYPNQYFLIGAHYDNRNDNSADTAYGSDDNGTGLCVLLELARLSRGFNTDYSIVFVAFNYEETTRMGSYYFADSARIRGDSLIGMLNAEMLGYDSNGDNKMTVISDVNSDFLSNLFISAVSKYQINLVPVKSGPGMIADHAAFWYRGFKAITTSEYVYDLTPHFHTGNDRWYNLTQPFFEKITKANIAAVLSWATGNYCEIRHTSLVSSFDSTSRTVTAEIFMPVSPSSGSNSPRLYYKINNGAYASVNPYNVNGRIYKFLIPGKSPGTKVSYYIAAQDSAGSVVTTLPYGGNGMNPPGNIPPQSSFLYYVLSSAVYSSTSAPKLIPAGDSLYDTIHIPQSGNIRDIRVNLSINYTNNSELSVTLYKSKYDCRLIDIPVCSGSNFVNTNFTDTAVLKINQGTAPYTGYFRGYDSVLTFKNKDMQGDWVLIISHDPQSATGTLVSWSLTVAYENPVSVKTESGVIPSEYSLIQNYPNPFNPVTNIMFTIPKPGLTKLEIFNIAGQRIETLADEYLMPGNYKTVFDGSKLSSGIYFCRLSVNNFTSSKRMVLIK